MSDVTTDLSTPRREAVDEIPIIDISPFLQSGTQESKADVAAKLRKACIDVGFFDLTGHGLRPGQIDEAVAISHRFFELPLEKKLEYRSTRPGSTGFVRTGGVNAQEQGDIKERFIMVRKTDVSSDEDRNWPGDDVVPNFSEFMIDYIQRCASLAQAVSRAFALSLDLPEHHFKECYDDLAYNCMINYYPPLTTAELDRNQLSFSPHTDYGGFTLLTQDSVGGLQVQNAAGEWIPVPPRDDTFVVNIGDLTAMWTNGLYTSTLHRALNVSGVSRISIPFFASPNHTHVIEPLPTCVSDFNPARYPATTVGAYLRKMIDYADSTGRPDVSAQTKERIKTS